jgi:hypothetical protein
MTKSLAAAEDIVAAAEHAAVVQAGEVAAAADNPELVLSAHFSTAAATRLYAQLQVRFFKESRACTLFAMSISSAEPVLYCTAPS